MGVGLGGTYLMMCDVQEHEFHRRYSDFRKWKYVDLEIQRTYCILSTMISVPRNIEVAVGQAQVVHIRSGIVMYTIFPSRWTVHKPTRSDSHMPLQAPLQHHLTHIIISRRRSPTSLPGGGRNGVAVATRPKRDSRTLTSDRGNINDKDTMHIYLYIHSANTMTNHFIWSGGVVPGQRKGKKAKKEKERIKEMKEHIQRERERGRERERWEGK